MKSKFKAYLERKNTRSFKWDYFHDQDIIEMWVADMDFPSPNNIISSIRHRAKQNGLGYTMLYDEIYSTEIKWWETKNYGSIQKEWILVSTGVISSISSCIKALTNPGDKVLIQQPVYQRFSSIIQDNQCEVISNDLVYKNGEYQIDWLDFEKKISLSDVKIFLLCNPHNPIGKSWSSLDLERMGKICFDHHTVMISDEIHRDFVYPQFNHHSLISTHSDFEDDVIVCTSPAKTFNIPGLKIGITICKNEKLREKIKLAMRTNVVDEPGIFAMEGFVAAYQNNEKWVSDLVEYLEENKQTLEKYLNDHLPEIQLVSMESTYLAWLDCSALKKKSDELVEIFLKQGKVRLNSGALYGKNGEGFLRMNIACARKQLLQALKQLKSVVDEIKKSD